MKNNSTLLSVSAMFAILTFVYTLYLVSHYNNQNAMLGRVLSLIVWVVYAVILYFINKKFKAKTSLGVTLVIAGLFLFAFANLFVCANSITWHIH